MSKSAKLTLITVLLTIYAVSFYLAFLADNVHAATGINDTINFQGKVVNADGTNVADGNYDFDFAIYTVDSGGAAIWTESWDSGTTQVTVTDGIFRVALGTHTDLPGSIDFNTDNIYLGITFNNDAAGEMTPRVRFAAVPYAFNAQKVAGLTVTDTTGTLTVSNDKTLTVSDSTTLATNSITFGGTQSLTLAAAKNVSFADSFTTSGANPLTLTTTGTTNVTLPTGGTLFSTETTSAQGDIIYASANNTLGLLNKGSDGECLKATTTTIQWGVCAENGSLFTDDGTFTYLTATVDDLVLGASTVADAAFYMQITDGGSPAYSTLFLGTDESKNGKITFYSSGVGETDPSVYADANGNLVLSAPSGTVDIGTSSGDIEMSLLTLNDNFIADKTITLSAAYSQNDFTFKRVLTSDAAGETQGGSLVYIEDSGDGTGTTVNGDLLKINSDLTAGTFTGNLLNLQVGGTDKFTVSSAGSIASLGPNITATAGLTLATTTTGNLTLDSGTTGDVRLGNGNNAKNIYIGNGTAGNTFYIGNDNTTKDTINIGSALDDVAITGDQWSITNAGVLTVASCSGCGGGGASLSGLTAATTSDTDNDNANNAILWDWSTLTTQTAFTLSGGSAMTSGSVLGLTANTFVHTALNDVGQVLNLSFTDASTNTNNGGVTSGITITPTVNTSGAGTKTINGINIAAPTMTACDATGTCTYNGLKIAGGSTANVVSYGLYVDAGTGSGTEYTAALMGGNVGIGDATPDASLDVNSSATSGNIMTVGGADSAVTLAGDISGLSIDMATNYTPGTNNRTGVNIANISGGGSAETAISIGTGWDVGLAIASGGITISGGSFTYSGAGRPTKTITLAPEYAGGVLTAFYGAGTDTNITGSMTSDIESTTNYRSYYQWQRTTDATLHYYTVAVRIKLPKDFSDWATSNAIQIDYATDSTSAAANVVDARIYLESNSTAVSATQTGKTSAVASTWTTITIDKSSDGLNDNVGQDWDTADQSAVIYLRMGSASSNKVKIGDIKLNYLAAF